MSEPRTLILSDVDDEQTLVDRAQISGSQRALSRSVDPALHQPQERRGGGLELAASPNTSAWSSVLSNHRREIVELGVVLALIFGLGLVVHQQWRVAGTVREALVDIRALRRDMDIVRPEALPPLRSTYGGGDVARRVAASEPDGEEREALQRRAAALIASNNFAAALYLYETLAELSPDDETFRDFIRVLRAKLRCDPSVGFGSGVCR